MRALGLPKVALFYGAVAIVGLLGMWAQGNLYSTLVPSSLRAGTLHVVLGLGIGLSLVLVSRFLGNYFDWGRRLVREFQIALGELRPREALMLAASSAFAEELLFRGVLLPALGLWISALVFGVMHTGPNRNFLPWTVMACVVGVLFGALFVWTQSLVAPILAHGVVNYLNLKALCCTPQTGSRVVGSTMAQKSTFDSAA